MNVDDDPHPVPLSRFRLHPRESFRYEYDFTANWRVDIRLEEIGEQQKPGGAEPNLLILWRRGCIDSK